MCDSACVKRTIGAWTAMRLQAHGSDRITVARVEDALGWLRLDPAARAGLAKQLFQAGKGFSSYDATIIYGRALMGKAHSEWALAQRHRTTKMDAALYAFNRDFWMGTSPGAGVCRILFGCKSDFPEGYALTPGRGEASLAYAIYLCAHPRPLSTLEKRVRDLAVLTADRSDQALLGRTERVMATRVAREERVEAESRDAIAMSLDDDMRTRELAERAHREAVAAKARTDEDRRERQERLDRLNAARREPYDPFASREVEGVVDPPDLPDAWQDETEYTPTYTALAGGAERQTTGRAASDPSGPRCAVCALVTTRVLQAACLWESKSDFRRVDAARLCPGIGMRCPVEDSRVSCALVEQAVRDSLKKAGAAASVVRGPTFSMEVDGPRPTTIASASNMEGALQGTDPLSLAAECDAGRTTSWRRVEYVVAPEKQATIKALCADRKWDVSVVPEGLTGRMDRMSVTHAVTRYCRNLAACETRLFFATPWSETVSLSILARLARQVDAAVQGHGGPSPKAAMAIWQETHARVAAGIVRVLTGDAQAFTGFDRESMRLANALDLVSGDAPKVRANVIAAPVAAAVPAPPAARGEPTPCRNYNKAVGCTYADCRYKHVCNKPVAGGLCKKAHPAYNHG